MSARMLVAMLGTTVIAAASPSLCAAAPQQNSSDARDAQQQVNEAYKLLNRIKQDRSAEALIRRAKAVMLVPRFAQGGLIVGGRGGEGVLMKRTGPSQFSDPVFYDIGGASIGAQAGVDVGSIALFLLTDDALRDVSNDNNWSLNAKSGLTVVNYSAKAQAGWGRADVVVWSDTAGAYAGATIGLSDIARDVDQTRAYYPGAVDGNRVLDGQLHNGGARILVSALSH